MLTRSSLVILLWSLFLSLLTIYWISKNTVPPAWDQSNYLEASEHLYKVVRTQGLWEFMEESTLILGRKAPLLPVVTVPLYAVFGSSPQIALVINILFFLLFVFFYFQLARIFVGERIAVGAVLIISSMPLFYGLLRNYFVEFGLMTLVTIWIFLLVKSRELASRIYVFWMGVVFGLGMLMKFHFFLFIAGPFAFLVYRFIQKKGVWKTIQLFLKRFEYFMIPATIITFPWYLRNIKTVLWHAMRATNPDLLGDVYYGSLYSFKNIEGSLSDFINFSISGYWFLLFVFLSIVLIIKKEKISVNYFLVLWFLLPFLIFLIGPNKDYRLLLPALPPFGLFLSWLWWKILDKKSGVYFAFLMLLPTLIFINSTFIRIPVLDNRWVGPILISDKKIGSYVVIAKEEYWPISEILIYLNSLEPTTRKKMIISASESSRFNINNLKYFANKEGVQLEINTASYFGKDTPVAKILDFVANGDYLIMKIGGDSGPAGLNYFNKDIEQAILDDKNLTWKLVENTFIFPDGGRLLIAKKL